MAGKGEFRREFYFYIRITEEDVQFKIEKHEKYQRTSVEVCIFFSEEHQNACHNILEERVEGAKLYKLKHPKKEGHRSNGSNQKEKTSEAQERNNQKG